MHLTFTAIKYRFFHSATSLINSLLHQFMNSLDDVLISEQFGETLCRSFWDSPPIVHNITKGLKIHPFSCNLEFNHAAVQAVVHNALLRNEGCQKSVYNHLVHTCLVADINSTLIRRCTKYFSADLDPCSSFDSVSFSSVFDITNLMGYQVSCNVLKTLLGSWLNGVQVYLEIAGASWTFIYHRRN